jgi:hypothetical protein
MPLPIGADGGPREQPQGGPCRAYLLGLWYVGLHESEYQGEVKKQEKTVAVFELEQRMGDNKRFCISAEVTFSGNEKSNLRKQYGPVFAPQSFAWSNEMWGDSTAVIIRNERIEGNFIGPCMIVVRTERADGSGPLKNAAIGGMAAMPHGTDPITPENNYGEQVPWMVAHKRGEITDKPCGSLIHYRPENYDDAPPVHQSAVNKESADVSKATALTDNTDDIPWNDDQPQF